MKRRRGSADTNSLDGQMPSKKPRVFFSEEQKESLRRAYIHDPYPNQNTIEQLAGQLGVSSKTIVNWFHNHRMRAKQQQHNSSGSSTCSSGSFPPQNASGIKVEQDDLSNHSDSVSSDNSQYRGAAGPPGADTGQWMFPTFEAVGDSRRASVTSTDSSLNGKPEGDLEIPQAEDLSVPRRTSTPMPKPAASSSNKRKRANPQRAIEGVQLDKSIQPDSEKGEGETETVQQQDEDNLKINNNNNGIDSVVDPDNPEERVNDENKQPTVNEGIDTKNKHNPTVEKLQKSLEAYDMDWDEVDRQENIEKLAKNITTEEPEEWEF